jgi:hypothetical protein
MKFFKCTGKGLGLSKERCFHELENGIDLEDFQA